MANNIDAQTKKGGQLFGDWVVHCETDETQQLSCKMSQMAIVEETSEPLLRINIRYQPQLDDTYIQFVLPLGISLHSAPTLSLDQQPAGTLPIDLCLPDGCYSTFQLTNAVLERFLSMKRGQITLLAGSGDAIKLPLSGDGSRAAYSAMREMAKQLSNRRYIEKSVDQ